MEMAYLCTQKTPMTNASMHRTSRDQTFDMLKGLAIILVVLGHCQLFTPPQSQPDYRRDVVRKV